ncbi:MAG TPA: TRAP transporter small permease [Azospirillaceae bacterium]|nr:TRAP transporter small permease [Azospirillaceae bacterium]
MTVESEDVRGRSGNEERAPAAPARWVGRVLGSAAAVLLFGMSVMTTADVVGRAVSGVGVPGSYELTALMMAALIFVALPLTTERGEHVTVDLLDHVLPQRAVQGLARIMDLLGAVVLAALAWQLWLRGGSLAADGAFTDRLRVPLAPVAYLAGLCTGVAAVALIGRSLAGRSLAGRSPGTAGGPR